MVPEPKVAVAWAVTWVAPRVAVRVQVVVVVAGLRSRVSEAVVVRIGVGAGGVGGPEGLGSAAVTHGDAVGAGEGAYIEECADAVAIGSPRREAVEGE
jgi:hypothetical protein